MISIVVPVYNCQKHLERCIHSIICQTYKEIEILLINDGSTDNSLDICIKCAKTDKRIRVFSKDNGGVSSARNFGMESANGKYVQFIDSDDFIEPDYCEKFIDAIENNDCDLAVSAFNNVYEQAGNIYDNIMPVVLPFDGVFCIREYVEKINILKNFSPIVGGTWNKIYLLENLRKHQIKFREDINLHEDSIFNFEIYKHIEKVYIINEPLYNYYHTLGNLSLSKKKQSNLHFFIHAYYESYKGLFRYFDIYRDEIKTYLENNCYHAYLVCMLNISDGEKIPFSSANDKIKAVLKDEIFTESIPYAKPSTYLYKFIHFLIRRKNILILKIMLSLLNLKHRVFMQ